jgi:hypothetical protein
MATIDMQIRPKGRRLVEFLLAIVTSERRLHRFFATYRGSAVAHETALTPPQRVPLGQPTDRLRLFERIPARLTPGLVSMDVSWPS